MQHEPSKNRKTWLFMRGQSTAKKVNNLVGAAPATTASLTPSLGWHGIDHRPMSHKATKLAANSACQTSSLLPNSVPLPSRFFFLAISLLHFLSSSTSHLQRNFLPLTTASVHHCNTPNSTRITS